MRTITLDLGAGALTPGLARLVADYIAGMTDRYALLEHQRLFALDRPA